MTRALSLQRSIARRAARGFTLTESLAVLALIGVLAVTASPTFIRLLRDRRVNRAAMHLVDAYRTGRTRAMGHGQPILVVWDPASGLNNTEPGSKGLVKIIEPIVTANTPTPNCQTAQWTNFQPGGTAGGVQEYSRVDFKSGRYTYTDATFYDDVVPPASQAYAEICFTPAGAAYIRTSAAAAFRRMTGVASFTVVNSETTISRTVFIPPNGVARLQL
ncbi:MAG: prepilin-type N-terminal cleavage/methylation domain-containing protein [Minicystis sp.]